MERKEVKLKKKKRRSATGIGKTLNLCRARSSKLFALHGQCLLSTTIKGCCFAFPGACVFPPFFFLSNES